MYPKLIVVNPNHRRRKLPNNFQTQVCFRCCCVQIELRVNAVVCAKSVSDMISYEYVF